jgi:hypothetical protein
MKLWLTIICLSSPVAITQAQIDQIADSRPYLASDGHALAWWDGGPAYHLASSGIIRITRRGIFSRSSTSSLRDLARLGWTHTACNLSAWALCTSENGHVMPSPPPRTVQDPASMPDGWKNMTCADSAGKYLVSNEAYDITACDILDEGLDIVYSGSSMYHRRGSIPKWEYWTLVILGIILVRAFSYNLQLFWDKQAVMQSQWPPVIATTVLFLLAVTGSDASYITEEDQILFWSTAAYVGTYLAFHMSHWLKKKCKGAEGDYQWPLYNMVIGALQLVTFRLYSSSFTPYTMVLTGGIGFRFW